MKIGLFFGSFNPIHTGHLIIANIVQQNTEMEEVWFIISPQNPFKKNSNLLHEFDRYDLVTAAIAEDFKFRASDVEFAMPRPSYTIDTLTILSEKHPNHEFSLIIGSDNLKAFRKWKNHEEILKYYQLVVYPRPNAQATELVEHSNVQLIEAPEMDISATLIRSMVREGKSIKYLVPQPVEDMIQMRKLFL